MSVSLSRWAISGGLALVAVATVIRLASEGRWVPAALYGVLVPLGAAWEWRKHIEAGTPAAEVADSMVIYVALALGSAWVD